MRLHPRFLILSSSLLTLEASLLTLEAKSHLLHQNTRMADSEPSDHEYISRQVSAEGVWEGDYASEGVH